MMVANKNFYNQLSIVLKHLIVSTNFIVLHETQIFILKKIILLKKLFAERSRESNFLACIITHSGTARPCKCKLSASVSFPPQANRKKVKSAGRR